MPNFIIIEETFCGRTYGRTYASRDGHLRPALLGRLCRRVDLIKTGAMWTLHQPRRTSTFYQRWRAEDIETQPAGLGCCCWLRCCYVITASYDSRQTDAHRRSHSRQQCGAIAQSKAKLLTKLVCRRLTNNTPIPRKTARRTSDFVRAARSAWVCAVAMALTVNIRSRCHRYTCRTCVGQRSAVWLHIVSCVVLYRR